MPVLSNQLPRQDPANFGTFTSWLPVDDDFIGRPSSCGNNLNKIIPGIQMCSILYKLLLVPDAGFATNQFVSGYVKYIDPFRFCTCFKLNNYFA